MTESPRWTGEPPSNGIGDSARSPRSSIMESKLAGYSTPATSLRCRRPMSMLAAFAARAGVLTTSRTSNLAGSASTASAFRPIGYTEVDCLRNRPFGMATTSVCRSSLSEPRSESMRKREPEECHCKGRPGTGMGFKIYQYGPFSCLMAQGAFMEERRSRM